MSLRLLSIGGLALLLFLVPSSQVGADARCRPQGVAAQVVRDLRQIFARHGEGIERARRMAPEIPDPAMRRQFLENVLPLERINRARMIESNGNGAPLPGLALQRRIELGMARMGIHEPSSSNSARLKTIQVQASELDGSLEFLADHLRRSIEDPYFRRFPDAHSTQRRILAEVEQAIERGHLSYGEYLNLSTEGLIALDYYPEITMSSNLRTRIDSVWQTGMFPMPLRTHNSSGDFGLGDFVPSGRGGLIQLRITRFEPGVDIPQARPRLPLIDQATRYTDTAVAEHDVGHLIDLGEAFARTSSQTSEAIVRTIARLRRTGEPDIARTLEAAFFIQTHEDSRPSGLRSIQILLDDLAGDTESTGPTVLLDYNTGLTVSREAFERTRAWLRQRLRH